MRTVYLDYNATTPLDPAVREAMLPFLDEIWGNPSSIHHVGRRARAMLDDARERAAKVLGGKPSEVIFTSGATESCNLAILGTARLLKDKGQHIITSAIEHHAVLHPCEHLARKEGFALTILPVNREGLVSVDDLEAAIRADTILVSIMAANNEIGTVQPVADLGVVCREHGVLLHTDAVQWFGKMPFTSVQQFHADLVSVCAHKFHGPKGAGLLFTRSPLHPNPLFLGGGHENERRAGTENLAAIVGMAEALERFVLSPVFQPDHLRPLSTQLRNGLRGIQGVRLLVAPEHSLPNTVAFIAEGADSISLLAGLDLEGVCASSGSACSAGSLKPSHVVAALGYDTRLASSLVRLSLGRDSTQEEVAKLISILPEVIHRAQTSQQPSDSR
jgi:cysteine desulfurase